MLRVKTSVCECQLTCFDRFDQLKGLALDRFAHFSDAIFEFVRLFGAGPEIWDIPVQAVGCIWEYFFDVHLEQRAHFGAYGAAHAYNVEIVVLPNLLIENGVGRVDIYL